MFCNRCLVDHLPFESCEGKIQCEACGEEYYPKDAVRGEDGFYYCTNPQCNLYEHSDK